MIPGHDSSEAFISRDGVRNLRASDLHAFRLALLVRSLLHKRAERSIEAAIVSPRSRRSDQVLPGKSAGAACPVYEACAFSDRPIGELASSVF
jgi:hypothetical protein